jgi:hypothetical protein
VDKKVAYSVYNVKVIDSMRIKAYKVEPSEFAKKGED